MLASWRTITTMSQVNTEQRGRKQESIVKPAMAQVRNMLKFSPPDPWRYSLWDYAYDYKNRFLTFKKIFIKRDEHVFSESTVMLRIYKKDEIGALLKKVGFKKVEFYSGWDRSPFRDDTFEYIIAGSK